MSRTRSAQPDPRATLRGSLPDRYLTPDDIVSMVFTSTPDLHAEFPASAARAALGLHDVALLGAQEQDVPHGMARCIRVLVHCYTDRPREELRHVFLEGAAALRADLPQ